MMVIQFLVIIGMILTTVIPIYFLWDYVKIYPVPSPGFIKITTFERALCRAHVRIIHPKTKVVMLRSMEYIPNCVPIWAKVSIDNA